MENIGDLPAIEGCSCLGNNLDRLVQPSILVILAEERSLHGYAILQKLGQNEPFGIDKSGVYRTLKKMEESGHIKSEISDENNKSSKKIFSITDSGLDCLQNWMITLADYKKKLDKIIETGNKILKGKR